MRSAGNLVGDDAANLLQLLHQVRLRVQPARGVDDQHVEVAGRRLSRRRRGRRWPGRCLAAFLTISQPSRSLQMVSCSTAAARNVSQAATITFLPWFWQYFASLAIDVVLPAPLTPAIMTTVGPLGAKAMPWLGAVSSDP